MDASDQRRMEGYLQSQNYFQGVTRHVAERMLIAFIERTLPWLLGRIVDAIRTAWELTRVHQLRPASA